MNTFSALSEVALPQSRAATHAVAAVGGRTVSHADWLHSVQAWCAAFQKVPGTEVGLYFDDPLSFAAALWGAWHAGKTPVLASDLQPHTLAHLLPQVQACAGLLPDAVLPDGAGAAAVVLQPLSLRDARVVMFTSGSTGAPERIAKHLSQLDAEVHALQAVFGALADAPEAAHYDDARRKVLENALRDFRLGGAELPDAQKARFAEVKEELAALSAKFSQNVLDATDAFSLQIEDEARLSGLPADVVATARATAEKAGRPGWTLTLKMPCYLPVQTYADNRALREQLYRAHAMRASEFGDAALDVLDLYGAAGLRARSLSAALEAGRPVKRGVFVRGATRAVRRKGA